MMFAPAVPQALAACLTMSGPTSAHMISASSDLNGWGHAYETPRANVFDVSSTSVSGSVDRLAFAPSEAEVSTSGERVSMVAAEKALGIEARAQSRADEVNAESAFENLSELKRLTGWSWDELASALGRDRRSIHNWLAGKVVRPNNKLAISSLLRVIRYVDRGNAEQNRSLFGSIFDGEENHFQLLRDGKFDEVKVRAGPGVGRSPSISRELFGSADLVGSTQGPRPVKSSAEMDPIVLARDRKGLVKRGVRKGK